MAWNVELEDLFAKWKAERPAYRHFVKDGVVCEECWREVPRRILFVLKEKPDVDAIHDLRECGGYGWAVVARWAYGLQRATDSTYRDFNEADSKENRYAGLRAAALMNLKKSAGRTYSDTKEIVKYGREDAAFIKEELRIIDPHVVVLCGQGVDEGFDCAVPFKQEPAISDNCWLHDGRLFMKEWHPSYRRKARAKYDRVLQHMKAALAAIRSFGGRRSPSWFDLDV